MEECWMDELNKNQMIKLTGISESELESMTQTEFGEKSMRYLAQLAKVTRLSLKANRIVMKQCLTRDDDGHVICRFCQEGIPSWKQENSREHTSECPLNHIGAVSMAIKQLKYNKLGERDNHGTG
jgi:hypothetical protein